MSTANETFFIVMAVVAIGSAIGTVGSRNPLRAAVALLIHISALAGLFLSAHAQLLAVLQLIVYAGAVVVLFVFVIMLIGSSATISGSTRGLLTRTASIGVMGLLALAVAFSLVDHETPTAQITRCGPNEADCAAFGGVEAFGQALYRDTLLPFELVGITLLVAIIGAVAVARGRSAQETEATRKRHAEREAERAKQRERERQLSSEVAAHEGR